MGRHGEGLVQGEGLPRLYPSLTPQSGAERARQVLGASHVLTSACWEVGYPSQTAPGRGRGKGKPDTSLLNSFLVFSPVRVSTLTPPIFQMSRSQWFPGPCTVGLLVLSPCNYPVRRFLGLETHSLQLSPMIVKVSRTPHVVSLSPFSYTLCVLCM